jgi:hypothetical protein
VPVVGERPRTVRRSHVTHDAALAEDRFHVRVRRCRIDASGWRFDGARRRRVGAGLAAIASATRRPASSGAASARRRMLVRAGFAAVCSARITPGGCALPGLPRRVSAGFTTLAAENRRRARAAACSPTGGSRWRWRRRPIRARPERDQKQRAILRVCVNGRSTRHASSVPSGRRCRQPSCEESLGSS